MSQQTSQTQQQTSQTQQQTPQTQQQTPQQQAQQVQQVDQQEQIIMKLKEWSEAFSFMCKDCGEQSKRGTFKAIGITCSKCEDKQQEIFKNVDAFVRSKCSELENKQQEIFYNILKLGEEKKLLNRKYLNLPAIEAESDRLVASLIASIEKERMIQSFTILCFQEFWDLMRLYFPGVVAVQEYQGKDWEHFQSLDWSVEGIIADALKITDDDEDQDEEEYDDEAQDDEEFQKQ